MWHDTGTIWFPISLDMPNKTVTSVSNSLSSIDDANKRMGIIGIGIGIGIFFEKGKIRPCLPVAIHPTLALSFPPPSILFSFCFVSVFLFP